MGEGKGFSHRPNWTLAGIMIDVDFASYNRERPSVWCKCLEPSEYFEIKGEFTVLMGQETKFIEGTFKRRKNGLNW